MTSQAQRLLIGFIAGVSMLSCVGSDADSNNETSDTSTGPQTSATTPWSPNSSTTGVPTFGKNCRYAAESVFSAPSNQSLDDAFTFSVTENGAVLTLNVKDDGQTLLRANNLELKQGLKDKSYRNASGTATWSTSQHSGEVVDGTLCFSSKLGAATELQAEFSLVMKFPDGSHESVSGAVTIPAEAFLSDGALGIDSNALDIGL